MSAAELSQHSVFAHCPDPVRNLIVRYGKGRRAQSGEFTWSQRKVSFINRGLLALMVDDEGPALLPMGPGSVHGLEAVFTASEPSPTLAVLPSEWWSVPADAFVEGGLEDWAERLYAHQAAGRLRRIAEEAACVSRHKLNQRVARWLTAILESCVDQKTIPIKQSLLAEALNSQRTSANYALQQLETLGAIRIRRGRIEVRDKALLQSAACTCSAHSAAPEPT